MLIGDTVSGRYVLQEILGRGTSGVVYRASDKLLGDELALKILHASLGQVALARARFRNELLTARRLSHPHIIKVYDVSAPSNAPWYLTMELMESGSLRRTLDEEHKTGLPLSLAAAYIAQALEALCELHRAAVVHRDVKPENLLLASPGFLKLSDFSVASAIGHTSDLTGSGDTVGTPFYMSPEQCRAERVDARTDLYSLGLVFFELLTASRPFDGKHFVELADRHIAAPLPTERLDSALPHWLTEFLKRMSAKSPAERFQTAEQALRELVEHAPQTAAVLAPGGPTEIGLPREVRERRRKLRRWAGRIAMGLCATSAVSILAGQVNRDVAIAESVLLIRLDELCATSAESFPRLDAFCLRTANGIKRWYGLPPGRDYAAIISAGSDWDSTTRLCRVLARIPALFDRRGSNGWTVFGATAHLRHEDEAFQMIESGARLVELNTLRRNILHIIASENWESFAISRFFAITDLPARAFDIADFLEGRPSELALTPLGYAVQNRNVDLTRRLLERGSNQSQPLGLNLTPLMLAADLGSPYGEQIVRLLLQNPPENINARDGSGLTAVFHAVRYQRYGQLEEFACAKARGIPIDPNIPNVSGESPFSYSLRVGDRRAAQLLLQMGADPLQGKFNDIVESEEERRSMKAQAPPLICSSHEGG